MVTYPARGQDRRPKGAEHNNSILLLAANMSNRVKILMVGPVNGQLSLLSNKLRTLQKSKAGPFDICICAGPFFHQTTTDNNDNDAVVKQERQTIKDNAASDEKLLLDKSLTFDVPVLFVDAGNGLPTDLQAKIDNVKKRDDAEIDLDDDGNDNRDNNKSDEIGRAHV